ncbi:MAG TPA: TonB-dependent receptor [Steroidobacteraceae bacterium]
MTTRISILSIAVVALSMQGPSPASAAAPAESADSAQLEEVIVTARKRDERLIDIPESITVISADDLLKKGIQTVEDVGRQTPNLQLSMRQDLTTDVVIRGIGAYGDVLGVGFVIDNVPNFTDQTMRLEDVESVEILKGPQGTLYGASSIGGLVRYVSKRPEFNWQGETFAEVGNYSHVDVSAAQNMPLIDGKLALRVSAYDVKDDGFISNSALGINADPLTDYGLRAVLLYKPTDTLEALLTLRHSYVQNGGNIYIPVPTVKDYSYDARFFEPVFNKRSTYGSVLEINDQLPIGKLTTITSYTTSNTGLNDDISQTPPGIPGESYYTLSNNRPTEVGTQEIRLTSPSGGRFEWLAGAYGAIIKNVLLNRIGATFLPTPGIPTELYDFDTRRTDTAVFGTASYHVGPLRLDAGLRLTETVYDAHIYVELGGLPNQQNSITSRAALPKFSLSYALSDAGQVYATVAKGEEPGAVNTVSTAPIPYRSETSLSYETGIKGQGLDRKLEYDVAAFYVRNKDHQYQTSSFDPVFGLVTLTSNIGDSRTYGIEADATWHPTTALRFGISGGYLNAKWTRATYFGTPIDGNAIPNAPMATADLSTGYSAPVSSNLKFDANFDVSYTDAMWWDLPNTPASKEPPHFLGNARIALGSDHRGWQAAFRVANLFGAKYWTEYYPAFFPPGTQPCPGCTDLGAPGARKQFFASVAYKY